MPKEARDKYNYLAGRQAMITGQHAKKGCLVEIKESAGRGRVHIWSTDSKWTLTLSVESLIDPKLVFTVLPLTTLMEPLQLQEPHLASSKV
jgi:hypothetical protein